MNSNKSIINLKDWILLDLIFKNYKSFIYNIIPKKNDTLSEEDKKFLYKNKWVLKIADDPREINAITSLELYNNNLCIKIYKNSLHYDSLNKQSWYIMEKYENTIYNNFKYGQDNLIKLGKYMIEFFEWLHIENEKIHGDIKSNNIMFKSSYNDNPFKLIDYEFIDNQNIHLLCNEDEKNSYYYYHIGCEYNKPYFSFRMDLEAFGYVLHSMALSKESYYLLEWQDRALEYYESKKFTNEYIDLNFIRNSCKIEDTLKNNKYKDIIIKYFDIIKKQDWFENPCIEVYKDLKKIFLF